MNRIVVLLLLVVFVLTACSKKVLVSDYNKKKKFEVQNLEFEDFNSRAKVKYDNGQKKVSLNANIRIKKDSIIWVSLSAFLGIEVARVLVTPDSIVLINRLDRDYEVMDYKALSQQFNFNIDYPLIQAMLLGNMPMELNLSDELEKNKKILTIRQLVDQYMIENYINSKTMKLERVSIEKTTTQNTLNFNYGDFNMLSEDIFPYSNHILLSYNTDAANASTTQINIDHNKVEVGDLDLSFPFDIPSKYQKK